MKIGIFISVAKNSGGIFQYTSSILKALHDWDTDHEFVILKWPGNELPIEGFSGPNWSVVTIDPRMAHSKNVEQYLCGDGLDLKRAGINPEAEKFFKNNRIDLLILPAPVSVSFEWGVPYIMAIHDLQHRLQPEFPEVSAGNIWKSREYLFRNGAKFAEAILADSEVGKEDVLNCYGDYIAADRVYQLPFLPFYRPEGKEITDAGKRHIQKKYHLPENFLFYPAQFWLHKNHSRLIHAIHILRAVHKVDVPLVLSGSNSVGIKEEARELVYQNAMFLAEKLGVKDLVQHLGYVPDEDMPFLYAMAKALAMPTFFGPTNIPFLEAWAFGCPVISSDIRGIREQVGDAGILVDPRDATAMAQGVFKIWSDSVLRDDLIHKGFTRVNSYSSHDFAANLYSVVESVRQQLQVNSKSSDRQENNDVSKITENTEESKKYFVSAIVSTYNSERFIRGRLEDLENQTIADKLEIVIVNSGSQQNEEKIISEFQKKYSNIKYIRTNQRETVYAAWNRAIKASQGKFITNANTDDRLRQDAFEIMVNTLEANPEIDLVYANVLITETENEIFERCTPVGHFNWLNFNREDLLNKGCFVGPQPMWRRNVHAEYGYFDGSFVTSGDYEFWLRISQSRTFMHLPVDLGLYLRSPGGIEHSNREKQQEENEKILNLYRKAQAAGKIIRRTQVNTTSGHTDPRSEDMNSPEEMYQSIQQSMGNKQPEETIAALEKLAAAFPKYALAFNDLGVFYYNAGNKDKAQICYEKAVELDPDNIIFKKNLADFYYVELGHVENALKIFVEILQSNPQDIETLLITGHICVSLKKFDDAKVFYQRLLELEPTHEDARNILEKLSQIESKTSQAKSPQEIYHEMQSVLNNGDPTKAIGALEKLIEDFPDFALAHNHLGVFYYHTDEKDKACQSYETAVRLQPENITFKKNLADFYCIELGRIEDALKIYVDVLTTHPQDAETLMATGQICLAMEKPDDAADFFNKVLEIEPWNEDARNSLRALENSPEKESLSDSDISKLSADNFGADESEPVRSEKLQIQHSNSEIVASIIICLDGIDNRIKQCIESIEAHTEQAYEIIFINNGTTKGLLKWAQRLVNDNANYQLAKCDRTSSWAQCLNQTIKTATGVYVVYMHNDVRVTGGWLSRLLQCDQPDFRTGVVGPMTNEARGIQKISFLDDVDPNRFESDAKSFFKQNQYRRIPVLQLSSFFLMFRRELIDEIGDFDASLISEQANVVDLCRRSAARGFQNVVAGDIFVYHADRHKGDCKNSDVSQIPAEDQKRLKENWTHTADDGRLLKDFQLMTVMEGARELYQKGQIDQAVQTLLNAIGAIPEEKTLYWALAEISISSGQYQDAIDALNEIPSNSKSEVGYDQIGGLDEVGLESPTLVGSQHEELKMFEILGYAEEGLENYTMAAKCADRMLSIDPKSAPALNLKGVLAYRNKDSNSANKFLKKSIESDPGYGEPYSNLGTLNLEEGQAEAAWELLQKAFILNPSDLDIATNYHTLFATRGEHKRAEGVVREAAAIYPNSQKINYMLIDVLLQQGKHEEAMDEIESAIVKFGVEDGILTAALQVRQKLGPMAIMPSKKKTAVSCCMIIKDEEKHLSRCLASLKPIVDEIILVDTGSVDRSKEIATTFGAQVYDFEWKKDFAEARNFSIAKASGDWILIIDGDEVISPLDYKHFNNIVKNKPKAPVAYTITTRNYSALANIVGWVPNDGKYVNEEAAAGWIPSLKTRLFYGKDEIWFEGAVHELVDRVVKRKGFETKECRIPVHHYGRLDKERLARKGEIYFEIGEKKMEEMGDDIFAVREMAIQATTLEKNELAIKFWQRLIALKPDELMAADAYINMATVYNRLFNFEQALLVAKKAIAMAPDLKESHYNYALAELHLGNAQTSIRVLEELVQRMPDYPPAQFILSAAYFCNGDKQKGIKAIRKLNNTDLGRYLVYPFHELAQTLINAHMIGYAQLLVGAAIECDIVNKEILELFAEIIQMGEAAKTPTGPPRPLPLDRQPVNFESLPQ